MSWLKRLLPAKIRTEPGQRKKNMPEGVWTKCSACQVILYQAELSQNSYVCPKCNFHHRISARERLDWLFDNHSWQLLADDVKPVDRLKFRDSKKYRDRLVAAEQSTGESEALLVGRGQVAEQTIVAAAFEFGFMGGSMGAALGERFVRGVRAAITANCPFICFSASGGARMQEGLLSLMQMAKTSAALADLAAAKLPYIVVLTDPTMGGVSASLAMLGDIIVAEPNALIGFAGPRVIEQTVRQTLPAGFQRSEFLLQHGAIDQVIDRRELRQRLTSLIQHLHGKTL